MTSLTKFWKRFLIALGVLIAVCCVGLVILLNSMPTSEKHRPLIDIQDSHLMTTRGPIPFELSNRSAHYPVDENSAGKKVVAVIPATDKTPRLSVSLGIFDSSGKGSDPRVFLSGFTSTYDPAKLAVQPGAYYQLNQKTKNPLTVAKGGGTQSSIYLSFNWPQPLSDYDISMSGGSM